MSEKRTIDLSAATVLLAVITFFVGVIGGGLGSAFVGDQQFRRLETDLNGFLGDYRRHCREQILEERQMHERLATIETIVNEIDRKVQYVYTVEMKRNGSN